MLCVDHAYSLTYIVALLFSFFSVYLISCHFVVATVLGHVDGLSDGACRPDTLETVAEYFIFRLIFNFTFVQQSRSNWLIQWVLTFSAEKIIRIRGGQSPLISWSLGGGLHTWRSVLIRSLDRPRWCVANSTIAVDVRKIVVKLLVLWHWDQKLNVKDGSMFILEMCLEPWSRVDVGSSTQEACDGTWRRHDASNSHGLVCSVS